MPGEKRTRAQIELARLASSPDFTGPSAVTAVIKPKRARHAPAAEQQAIITPPLSDSALSDRSGTTVGDSKSPESMGSSTVTPPLSSRPLITSTSTAPLLDMTNVAATVPTQPVPAIYAASASRTPLSEMTEKQFAEQIKRDFDALKASQVKSSAAASQSPPSPTLPKTAAEEKFGMPLEQAVTAMGKIFDALSRTPESRQLAGALTTAIQNEKVAQADSYLKSPMPVTTTKAVERATSPSRGPTPAG